MTEQSANPGRKWRDAESREDDQEKYYDTFRYTPYTTDMEFFRDRNIYQTKVARTTQGEQHWSEENGRRPRGNSRPDRVVQQEIKELLNWHQQIDATGIQVDVNEGVVTLAGNVKNQYEKQTAESITRNVLGVLDVKNMLDIKRKM